MAQKKTTKQTRTAPDTPAAEAVVDGQLAGAGITGRLRQISPVTAGLVGAVVLALGLSAWPYLGPYLLPQTDDPWQMSVDQDLADLRAGLAAVSTQQARITARLDTLDADLVRLDQTMGDVVQSVSQSVETMTAAIDRFDQQIAHLDEQLTTIGPSSDAQAVPQPAPDQASPEGNGPDNPPNNSPDEPTDNPPDESTDSEGLLPHIELPDLSGWWQGLSDWVGGLVSVDRIPADKSTVQ